LLLEGRSQGEEDEAAQCGLQQTKTAVKTEPNHRGDIRQVPPLCDFPYLYLISLQPLVYASGTFLYLKFLVVWALVLLADFVLEFRFEYLWPFWLFMRSVYDSFRYQGLAFSVFFVCVAFTSDIICLLFIPVQWLFFAASTYVWVQYVWHT
ncbi:Macoilin-2, partial [Xenotaenia resolanae]